MKLRVIHKGTAFLLLTLGLQIALFVQFFHLVDQAEQLAARERDQRQFTEAVNDLAGELGVGLMIVSNKLFGGAAVTVERPSEFKKRAAAIFRSTDRLVEKFPQFHDTLTELKRLVAAEYVMVSNGFNVPDDASMYTKISAVMSNGDKIKEHLRATATVQAMLQELRKQVASAEAQQLAARAQLKQQISMGMFAEIALTVILLIAFLVDITKRLSMLVQNAQAIPSGQELPRTVQGSDELSYLDSVLHQSSMELRRAAEQRRSLMSMVAHDLRVPLMASRLTVENMLQENSQDQRARTLKQQMNRLIGLVEDLLTVEKLEGERLDLNYDFIDVKAALDTALGDVAALANEKEISIQNDVASFKLPADFNRLVQVWANLLSNAIKYSPGGGRIVISSRAADGMLRLSVKDEGPGIPIDRQTNLFEKFYQVHAADQSQGFGLGLAICKLIVIAHGGKIGVISKPGNGSEFWFTLPQDLDDDGLEDASEPAAD